MRSRRSSLSRFALLIALLLVPLHRGGNGARASAQATTDAAPACQCPLIPPIATDAKPAPGKGYAELSLNDLEWAFSDLEAQYNGDWDQAMLAMAHRIDPSGGMKLWDKPLPSPASTRATASTGAITDYLIKGPPADVRPAPTAAQPQPPRPPPLRALPSVRPVAPQAPPQGRFTLPAPGRSSVVPSLPVPGAPAPGPAAMPAPPPLPPLSASRDPHAISDVSAGSGFMASALYTLARINKYGEPRFGLRKAVLRTARFMADDLSRIPQEISQRDANAARLARASMSARIVLNSTLLARWMPQDEQRLLTGIHQLAGQVFVVEHQSAFPDPAVEGDLNVDGYDLANAALDVIFGVDKDGKQEGLLHFYGERPPGPNGMPQLAGPKNPQTDLFDFIAFDLIRLAAKRGMFHGQAQVNSPDDALACKAFSALTALMRRPEGNLLRGQVFGGVGSLTFIGLGTFSNRDKCESCFQAARAARVLAGIQNDAEAKTLADGLLNATTMLGHMQPDFGAHLDSPGGAVNVLAVNGAYEAMYDVNLATARDFLQYAHGAGVAAFSRLTNDPFNGVRKSIDQAHQLSAKKRAQADAIPPTRLFNGTTMQSSGASMLRANADTVDNVAKRAQTYVDAWDKAVPDIDPKLIDPCAPPAAPPRVVMFAKGRFNRIMVKKIYVGVPMTLGVFFVEPYDKDEYAVTLTVAGSPLRLTARPIDADRKLFETAEFVVKP